MRWSGNRPSSLGLRWRLAGWVTLVTLLCTSVAFVAVYRGTGTQLRHQIDREISGDAGEFADNLALAHGNSPKRVAEAARRYVATRPFSASSTLLFACRAGGGTVTNRPELFGLASPDEGETPAEQEKENRLSAQLLTAGVGYSTVG